MLITDESTFTQDPVLSLVHCLACFIVPKGCSFESVLYWNFLGTGGHFVSGNTENSGFPLVVTFSVKSSVTWSLWSPWKSAVVSVFFSFTIWSNAHQDIVVCLNNCSWSEQSESLEWEGKRTEWETTTAEECRASEWNWVGKKSLSKAESALAAYLLSVCWVGFFFFLHFPFLLFSILLRGEWERNSPLAERSELVQPSHLTGSKNSLCCCECQSKRSARWGLPWVTLHRLVRACEMDNSLGGLSGLMTRFPGICATVPWPGSPSKELYYGAVLPLYCYCYHRYGSTGG